jgi:hypothetical protein
MTIEIEAGASQCQHRMKRQTKYSKSYKRDSAGVAPGLRQVPSGRKSTLYLIFGDGEG